MTRHHFPVRGVAAALLTAFLLCGGITATPAGAAAPTLPPTTTSPTGAIPTPGPLDTLTSSASSASSASTASRTSTAASLFGARSSTPAARPTGPSGPQLSIAVDNGRTSAAPGQVLDYVLTLTNLGSSEVKGLRVTQSVPTGLTLVRADAGGQVKDGNVGWKVDLAAAKATTFHVRMKVSATPKELLRLATVACAGLASKTAPIVCASHSDQLPAGAAVASASSSAGKATTASPAGAVAAPAAAQAATSGGRAAIIAVVAGVVVVLVVLLTFLVVRRRRAPASTG